LQGSYGEKALRAPSMSKRRSERSDIHRAISKKKTEIQSPPPTSGKRSSQKTLRNKKRVRKKIKRTGSQRWRKPRKALRYLKHDALGRREGEKTGKAGRLGARPQSLLAPEEKNEKRMPSHLGPRGNTTRKQKRGLGNPGIENAKKLRKGVRLKLEEIRQWKVRCSSGGGKEWEKALGPGCLCAS